MMTRDEAAEATNTEIRARLREIRDQIASLSKVQASATNSYGSEHGRMRATSIELMRMERWWLNKELAARKSPLPVAA